VTPVSFCRYISTPKDRAGEEAVFCHPHLPLRLYLNAGISSRSAGAPRIHSRYRRVVAKPFQSPAAIWPPQR
jgi:hypothetical protein